MFAWTSCGHKEKEKEGGGKKGQEHLSVAQFPFSLPGPKHLTTHKDLKTPSWASPPLD